jgi:hypothetical protein
MVTYHTYHIIVTYCNQHTIYGILMAYMASMVPPGRQQARGEAASPARCYRRPRKTCSFLGRSDTTSASEMLRKYDMKGFYNILYDMKGF